MLTTNNLITIAQTIKNTQALIDLVGEMEAFVGFDESNPPTLDDTAGKAIVLVTRLTASSDMSSQSETLSDEIAVQVAWREMGTSVIDGVEVSNGALTMDAVYSILGDVMIGLIDSPTKVDAATLAQSTLPTFYAGYLITIDSQMTLGVHPYKGV